MQETKIPFLFCDTKEIQVQKRVLDDYPESYLSKRYYTIKSNDTDKDLCSININSDLTQIVMSLLDDFDKNKHLITETNLEELYYVIKTFFKNKNQKLLIDFIRFVRQQFSYYLKTHSIYMNIRESEISSYIDMDMIESCSKMSNYDRNTIYKSDPSILILDSKVPSEIPNYSQIKQNTSTINTLIFNNNLSKNILNLIITCIKSNLLRNVNRIIFKNMTNVNIIDLFIQNNNKIQFFSFPILSQLVFDCCKLTVQNIQSIVTIMNHTYDNTKTLLHIDECSFEASHSYMELLDLKQNCFYNKDQFYINNDYNQLDNYDKFLMEFYFKHIIQFQTEIDLFNDDANVWRKLCNYIRMDNDCILSSISFCPSDTDNDSSNYSISVTQSIICIIQSCIFLDMICINGDVIYQSNFMKDSCTTSFNKEIIDKYSKLNSTINNISNNNVKETEKKSLSTSSSLNKKESLSLNTCSNENHSSKTLRAENQPSAIFTNKYLDMESLDDYILPENIF